MAYVIYAGSRMTWLEAARSRIRDVDATLTKDATLKQRKAALRAEAWKHHGGTSWGKKTWGRAAREYLERHGQPPRTIADASPQSKLFNRLQAGDIVLMKDLELTPNSQKGITNP